MRTGKAEEENEAFITEASVRVIEVDKDKRRVFASWNHNAPPWIHESVVTKWTS